MINLIAQNKTLNLDLSLRKDGVKLLRPPTEMKKINTAYMGLFKKLFGAATDSNSERENQKNEIPWIELNSMEQVEAMVEKSKTKPQLIFKHSTRCGISRMVINQFKKSYGCSAEDVDLYYLDLLAYRSISDRIAEKFQVIHQSPQLLVVKNGVVVASESHSGINSMDLKKII